MPARKKSLEERLEDLTGGRPRSTRRLEILMDSIRTADRIDLLDRALAFGPDIATRCLAAALGSNRPQVFRKNAVRREVFVRFAAGSRARKTLDRLLGFLRERADGDSTCLAIASKRLAELDDGTSPEGRPDFSARSHAPVQVVAEEVASSAIGSLLAAAVEIDLLADHLRARQEGGVDRLLGYRLRRAQETVAAATNRLGLEFFGRPGETVPFDPRRHEYIGFSGEVASGMPVRLVTRGFQRAGAPKNPVIVQRAQVE